MRRFRPSAIVSRTGFTLARRTVRRFGYLDITWDLDVRAQISSWVDRPSGRDIRGGLEAALDEYVKLRNEVPDAQWVGDTREIGVISQEDQDWINNDWFPRLLETGVRYMAVVAPRSVIAKMAVESIVTRVEGTALTTNYVETIDEGLEWIASCLARRDD